MLEAPDELALEGCSGACSASGTVKPFTGPREAGGPEGCRTLVGLWGPLDSGTLGTIGTFPSYALREQTIGRSAGHRQNVITCMDFISTQRRKLRPGASALEAARIR